METKILAAYAANLSYDEIPYPIVERSKDCILDTLAAAIFGADLPWSRILIGYVRRYGIGGKSSILGYGRDKIQAPLAALVNGALAHSFELDNVRQPGAGVHAGATLTPAALAIAEELETDGKEFLTAFVAGCEVMFRIGHACRETSEKLGFHAPGLTGTFGAAATAGRLLRLNAQQMVHAFGIAGSLSSGLLEFVKSGTGGMVKRLHLGRASEGGLLAASLAKEGFTGPETILEGSFGFLHVFSREPDFARLTHALGKEYEVLNICMKRFPCHINAQAPVQAVQELRNEQPFSAADVEEIIIAGGERLVTHHNIPAPGDVMMGQYSVPFSVALSLYRDPEDPRSFSETSLKDPEILSLSKRIHPVLDDERAQIEGYRGARVTVRLKDGRSLVREVREFKGSPAYPLTRQEIARKFRRLASGMGKEAAETLLGRIEKLEVEKNIGNLFA
ncbi:MAG: MmgE/PrpD family protein [Deltaproteobacteria bacterium]|nr:MmgE/PrpD family protein [Deltaproteobacteria bacterium]